LLRQLSASLLITTYQAGHLIIARTDSTLNTNFVPFAKPMGMVANGSHLLVGTATGIREFRNVPALAARLASPQRHDAVYAFRNHHVTGDIDIHEMALGAGGECWFVNTRFSCLCTLDQDHSFVPRWRPPFITGLAPEDRCHLNGLAMKDGIPSVLTALGATDTPRGWRANKKDGGVLLDYVSGETLARGLSMPHSPRLHRGKLWVLESGTGSLLQVEAATGRTEAVARVPGFARGLDFAGPLAFIGLSQLRETNAFTDIPITADNADRMSGVWVVNIESGQTVAFLKFDAMVQEIFAVQLLLGAAYPEVLDDGAELLKSTYILPEDALQQVAYTTPVPLPGVTGLP
jgi:uncharacterized protein (TIGR03032 family)